MYNDFFGLREAPFSIAPDPRYLYLSERHKEALAHLMYGVQGQGGFIVITGEVGTGKTTVCRCFLDSVPEHVDVALVLNPKLSARELLASICDELALRYPAGASIKRLIDVINSHLLASHAQGRHTVLVIDEAQNLTPDVLEQLRLLTNLETGEKKLLQIVLLGQPELQEMLDQRELRQLAQRITARYHLNALDRQELSSYIRYRLSVAGGRHLIFSPAALKTLYRLSNGIPRLINLIADRALLGAYSQNSGVVDSAVIRKAAGEVLGRSGATGFAFGSLGPRQLVMASMVASVVAIVALTWALSTLDFLRPTGSAAVVQQSAPAEIPAPETGAEIQSPDTEDTVEQTLADSISGSDSDVDENPANQGDPEAQGNGPETRGNDPGARGNDPETRGNMVPESDSLEIADPEQSGPSGDQLLGQWVAGRDNTGPAYRSLFQAWNLTYGEDGFGSACGYAQAHGLRCLHRQGNWRSLEQLDRPAVLRLHNAVGEPFHVALLGLDEERARIALDGTEHVLPRAQVDRYWLGDYSVVWKLPPYELEPGDNAISKETWLQQSLATVRGKYRLPDAVVNGAGEVSLEEQVAWFQRRAGLIPDGIPGTVTLIRLNSELDPTLPRLSGAVIPKHLARQD
ncbi:ExeA family protein [Hydrocarboniclastica marina]|uniref:Peptidoglycan-binding protein n=1 Tax=Hydrocarboniclastica marina TaxID=2259620 RepID=A0A4P7XGU5_9ALTE|nr:ExeA family protein [Hydrocarboniclastica marina]QCF26239.1 peptidoglycan-binding protein [Hydrocarboniclastica marina]